MLTRKGSFGIIIKGDNNAKTGEDKELNRNISYNVARNEPTTDIYVVLLNRYYPEGKRPRVNHNLPITYFSTSNLSQATPTIPTTASSTH